ncbi:unnamed protein product [Ilex paraguariensis]|uniref:Uncharacterized protein n=1 Tax=Ilex paraguariensis TaxID=185542 RepID=A0ABC8V5M6_9AQUA
MAARAHDVAALALRGQSACLNFADSVWRLPVPASTAAKDIRMAAVMAAEGFRPKDEAEVCGSQGGPTQSLGTNFQYDHQYPFPTSCPTKLRHETVETCDEVSGINKITADTMETMNEAEKVVYLDPEALFDVHGLLVDMAEGLLLSPPPCLGGDFGSEEVEEDAELSLWSY